MAYPYLPAMGYPYQMPTMTQYTPQTQAQSQSNIIWVQGIEAMKSYPVNAGQSVMLMDSETQCFGIKAADASGMPLPLRIFDFVERTAQAAQNKRTEPQIDVSGFITRDEFEARIAPLIASQAQPKKQTKKDGESNAE